MANAFRDQLTVYKHISGTDPNRHTPPGYTGETLI